MSTAFLPALEQARLVRERQLSAVELVEDYLARIERLDPELNAYVTVCADEAPAQARAPLEGPFAGVPLPIKDLVDTAGIRTTYSCKAFADNVPAEDVELVRRIRAAGFVLLGKTNTPEFGTTAVTESGLNGICRNPWDTARTPGGSSGGAAAAVAAGLAPLAQASDGGGSIRIPASCCGLFGLKPSRGRTSPAPRADAYGFSVAGSLARTVAGAGAVHPVRIDRRRTPDRRPADRVLRRRAAPSAPGRATRGGAAMGGAAAAGQLEHAVTPPP